MKKYILIFIFFSTLTYGQKKVPIDATEYMHKKDSVMYTKINTEYLKFTAATLDGDTITEKNLIGKVTFINFWFEGCAYCMAEMDELNALYTKFKYIPSFQFISFTRDPANIARETVEKQHILFPVCPISSDCYRLNYSYGFPFSIIIDKTGKLRYFKAGMLPEKNIMTEEFQKYENTILDLLSN
jgi:peroxiredoxin